MGANDNSAGVPDYPVTDMSKSGRRSRSGKPAKKKTAKANSSKQGGAVRICAEWFERDKRAKQPYLDEMQEMYKLYMGDHWDLLGPDGLPLRTAADKAMRPNVVENITFAMIEGLTSEFEQDVEIIDFPVEPEDEEIAVKMTRLKQHLMQKNNLDEERKRWLKWFVLYGTGIWQTWWDPDWQGGRGPNRWFGDVRWQAIHPQMLYPDARCKEDINEGYRCHKAYYLPLEEIEVRFPDRAQYVQEDPVYEGDLVMSDTQSDLGWYGFDERSGQAYVVETWYKGKPLVTDKGEDDSDVGMHVIFWTGRSNSVYLGHSNYIYADPGEIPDFPWIVKQCYHRDNSVWGFGEAFVMKNPQIVQNKTVEILVEGHWHQAVGKTFYEPTALDEDQLADLRNSGTLPGMWHPARNIDKIRTDFPRGMPSSVGTDIERRQRFVEMLIGRFDISQGRTPGSVTAFRALNLLAVRAQVRLRSKESAIRQGYEESAKYVNDLIARFYDDPRTYRIIGRQELASFGKEAGTVDIMRDTFDPKELKRYRVYGDKTYSGLEWDAEAQRPGDEAWQMIPDFDYEAYSPEFDTICKVSPTLPTDRMFYIEMAKELLMAGKVNDHIFWYVLQNGRFPPWEDVEEEMRVMEEQAQQLALMHAQQGSQQGEQGAPVKQIASGEPAEPLDMQQIIEQLDPQTQQAFLALPPGEQQAVLQQALSQQ